jgi:lipopolysaccharide transport system ATP-binding protein
MKPILEIKNVSKKFRIQHNAQPYLSLRESLSSLFKREKKTSEEFYALNDVSFNIEPGGSIGIIGKNGAGKSTLLKILSKITPPSSGSITCRGNIASLLEVGTGFHPELTGRENIFLNGSILGMKRRQIQSKFDEIVDFSGTEKFLDTPLKHYSSGMQLRLAFSVAAFLEPEILVIDEVLAVGDAEFQKKCMGKMEEVSHSGKTILFVSHNMPAVLNLCHKAVLLNEGQIMKYGETRDVISTYYSINEGLMEQSDLGKRTDRSGNGKCRFQRIWITDKNNNPLTSVESGEHLKIHALVKPQTSEIIPRLFISVSFCTGAGERIFSLGSGLLNKKLSINGMTEVVWTIDKLQLAPDEYIGDLYLFETDGGGDMYDMIEHAFKMIVIEGDFHRTGKIQTRGRDLIFVDFDISEKVYGV